MERGASVKKGFDDGYFWHWASVAEPRHIQTR